MKNDLNARIEFHAQKIAADRAAVKLAATQKYRALSRACDMPIMAAALALALD